MQGSKGIILIAFAIESLLNNIKFTLERPLLLSTYKIYYSANTFSD